MQLTGVAGASLIDIDNSLPGLGQATKVVRRISRNAGSRLYPWLTIVVERPPLLQRHQGAGNIRPWQVPGAGVTQGEQKVHGALLIRAQRIVYLTNVAGKVFPMLLDAIFKRPKTAPPAKPLPRIELPKGYVSFVAVMVAKKGGVGKSTLAVNIGVAAAYDGLRVLILDTDLDEEQQNCMHWYARRQKVYPDSTNLKVMPCAIHKVEKAIAWGRRQGFELIIVDTAGRDLVHMSNLADQADFMLSPGQMSQNDLDATGALRRLWSRPGTPSGIVVNGAIQEDSPRTRHYWKKYSELGPTMPGVLVRRVEYIDAMSRGMGVSEYRSSGPGDLEIRRLVREMFSRVKKRGTVQ